MSDQRNQLPDDAARRELLDALLEQAEWVKRVTSDAAYETSVKDHSWSAAIDRQRWWLCPNYSNQVPDWAGLAAHAKRLLGHLWNCFVAGGSGGLHCRTLPGNLCSSALVCCWHLSPVGNLTSQIENFN
jgi:hypothetical protein